MNEDVLKFQDLGDLGQTLRTVDEVGPAGVEPLHPDEDESHNEALAKIRAIIDEYYGDSLDNLSSNGDKIIIERLVCPADDVPHIEFRRVESRE
jgi:hypothetical protein